MTHEVKQELVNAVEELGTPPPHATGDACTRLPLNPRTAQSTFIPGDSRGVYLLAEFQATVLQLTSSAAPSKTISLILLTRSL